MALLLSTHLCKRTLGWHLTTRDTEIWKRAPPNTPIHTHIQSHTPSLPARCPHGAPPAACPPSHAVATPGPHLEQHAGHRGGPCRAQAVVRGAGVLSQRILIAQGDDQRAFRALGPAGELGEEERTMRKSQRQNRVGERPRQGGGSPRLCRGPCSSPSRPDHCLPLPERGHSHGHGGQHRTTPGNAVWMAPPAGELRGRYLSSQRSRTKFSFSHPTSDPFPGFPVSVKGRPVLADL